MRTKWNRRNRGDGVEVRWRRYFHWNRRNRGDGVVFHIRHSMIKKCGSKPACRRASILCASC